MYQVQKQLTYGELPWASHPIDLVEQPQGFGPFAGPWTPHDFNSPAMCMAGAGIDIGYSGDNDWKFGPGYDVETVFTDRSTDMVHNVRNWMTDIVDAVTQPAQSSTISNAAIPGATPPPRSSLIANIKAQMGARYGR